jgi:hypothetical protein
VSPNEFPVSDIAPLAGAVSSGHRVVLGDGVGGNVTAVTQAGGVFVLGGRVVCNVVSIF